MNFNPSPLRYPGGKFKTYEFVRELILANNCTSYIEPFAGGAAVALELLKENVVKKIVINDYDRSIFSIWYTIKHNPKKFIRKIENTEITIKEWEIQKSIQENKDQADLFELAFSTLFLNRTNRSGIIKAGVIGGKSQIGNYKLDCRFNKNELIRKIESIAIISDRIDIYNLDANVFIEKVIKKTRNSFTFFDPPYYEKGPSLYTNFYKHEDHEKLSRKIKQELRNRKWIVTYDKTEEIKKLYKNLNYTSYYLSYSAERKRQGQEYMFFSNKTNYNLEKGLLNIV